MSVRPAWLLLHGFAGSPDGWRPVIEAAGLDLVEAPSLGGHGQPSAATVSTFRAEVERLATRLRSRRAEDPERPWLVAGYSLGGRLALGLLIEHPELFAGAALIGAHPGLDRSEERAERRANDERWARRIEADGLERFAELWQQQPIFGSQATLAPALLAAQRRARVGHEPAALAAAMRALSLGEMPCWRGRLREVGVPVELVVGELDAKFLALSREMEDLLPCSEVRTVAQAGHNVPLERPDAVADVLIGCEARLDELRVGSRC